MKILHVLLSEAWGGLETYSLDFIAELMKSGVACELLCKPQSRVAQEALIRNIPTCARLARVRGHFTHVQVHRRQDLPITRLYLLGKRTPLLYSLYMSAPPKRGPYHRWIYGRVSAIVSSAEWVSASVRANFPIQADRVHLIRYGRPPAPALYSPSGARGIFALKQE